jgi:hypothetical protein
VATLWGDLFKTTSGGQQERLESRMGSSLNGNWFVLSYPFPQFL